MNKFELQNLIREISDCADQLNQCLADELKALNENQYEKLITLAEQKQSLVDRLNQLDIQRAEATGEQDFSNFLIQLDPGQQLKGLWQATREKIKQCQHQNEVNGRLLERRNRITRETMAIFTGRNPSDETTYGPNGLEHGQRSMLPNVEA